MAFLSSIRVVNRVYRERLRQKIAEQYSTEHDDVVNSDGELALAAACYAISGAMSVGPKSKVIEQLWPWHPGYFKSTTVRRDLVKAAALICAEIERMDRLEERVLNNVHFIK